MGYYDTDPPDPGRLERSSRNTLRFTCDGGTFACTTETVGAIAAAMNHAANHPTHRILFRGVPQTWTRPKGGGDATT